jgi:hypothetical protein
MTSVSAARTGVASGINNAVARVASLLAIAVLGIVYVWSHDAALAARLDALHVPQAARAAASLARVGMDSGAGTGASEGKVGAAAASAAAAQTHADPDAGVAQTHAEPARAQADIAQAQAEALGAALRAVALVSALCALAGAALAAFTIRSQRPL